MHKKYISKLVAIVLIISFLAACTQIDSSSATTPQPSVGTSTTIPATPTITLTVTPTNIPITATALGIEYNQTLPLFDYDSSTPFNMTVLSEEEKNGVIIQSITFVAADPKYAARKAGKIEAFLVKPSKSGSYAGVLYMHGLGPTWGNRKQFLDEAVSLAQQGVVSLLPSGLFPWWIEQTGDAETDQMNVIKQVIELRRSVDFLLSQPGVDPQRIAYVGHDYSAMHGAVLSGVEKRIKAYVLMAGENNYSDWGGPGDQGIAYRLSMDAVDPLTYLPHAAPASLYFQFGEGDGWVSKESGDQSFNAASEPKKISWYKNAEHTLNDLADLERLTWLEKELNLNPAQ